MNLNEMIENMSREDIAHVMSIVKSNQPRSIDTSRRAKRLAINNLYFENAPLPYKSTYEEYKNHAEGIRQQCISGIDL